MDKEKARAMVFASFIGDALALGPHWIYDPKEISKRFGKISDYTDPPLGGYHHGKKAGAFTHYGDQTLVLLRSVTEKRRFDLQDFAVKWREMFNGYKGYVDQASAITLENFRRGKGPDKAGSSSDDLAGASRISPLVYVYRHDLNELVAACRAQTAMTHACPITIEAAGFFAKLAFQVLRGKHPTEAIEELAQEPALPSQIKVLTQKALKHTDTDPISAIMSFGQSCHAEEAFPCVIYLIAKYPESLSEALIQGTMAGGDSAGRNMLVGMILGAHLGMSAIPRNWLTRLAASEEIKSLLDSI